MEGTSSLSTRRPLFSIITAAFNAERTIAETIQSVQCQTLVDWEHIVVDDGSTDRTQVIVGDFREPRLRYVHQENQGRSVARNAGLSLATGQNVLFLDADDWLLEHALHEHQIFLSNHPEFSMSISDGVFCTDKGDPVLKLSEMRGSVEDGDILPDIVVSSSVIGPPHAVAVRRSSIEDHSIRFDPALSIGEDWLFWIELAAHARAGFLDVVSCKYRWHPGMTSLASSEAVRRRQLLMGREKVMMMSFFSTLTPETRHAFFYGLLLEVLEGQPDDQERVLTSPTFRALPAEMQAQLLCLVASEHLLRSSNADVATTWLSRASRLAPQNRKAFVMKALAELHPVIIREVIRTWRRLHRRRPALSPYRIAALNPTGGM